ncbi:myelin-associated oligodendrocyte basic protein [Thalictrum thalictroides]|uniref:Myelin-associated oligodendrocyte basic protein n=1 Tax=Thalictrum thalictroides TaxID=46969 RepID=A0A7J6XB74_THATH|nr:myelin-associated oligodendrocyte basic protein [Thalictrum thalictroides]
MEYFKLYKFVPVYLRYYVIFQITILVAAAGEQKFPRITNIADLKEALQKLGSISSSKTMAVEVLWTPQEDDDTLSEQELLEKYPLLKPLHDG